jgi:hypothetical protein
LGELTSGQIQLLETFAYPFSHLPKEELLLEGTADVWILQKLSGRVRHNLPVEAGGLHLQALHGGLLL